MTTQKYQNPWLYESIKTNQYVLPPGLKLPKNNNDDNFDCPTYIKKKNGIKLNPIEGDPCMFCAHPSCPLIQKIYL